MPVSDPYVIGPSRPQRSGTAFERVYGTDLARDSDYILTSAGDLKVISGLAALRANFMRALVTVPGEIFWRPRYGVGLLELLNSKVTAAAIEEKKSQIRTYLMREPLVDKVGPLSITLTATTPGLLVIDIGIVVARLDVRWNEQFSG